MRGIFWVLWNVLFASFHFASRLVRMTVTLEQAVQLWKERSAFKSKEIRFIKGFISIISIQSKTWAQMGACRSEYTSNNNICRKVNMQCFLAFSKRWCFSVRLNNLTFINVVYIYLGDYIYEGCTTGHQIRRSRSMRLSTSSW